MLRPMTMDLGSTLGTGPCRECNLREIWIMLMGSDASCGHLLFSVSEGRVNAETKSLGEFIGANIVAVLMSRSQLRSSCRAGTPTPYRLGIEQFFVD